MKIQKSKLKEEQQEKLEKLLDSEYLETSIVYKYKLQFQDIYNSIITKEEAKTLHRLLEIGRIEEEIENSKINFVSLFCDGAFKKEK